MLGLTYVPHYHIRDTFVAPGNVMLTLSHLQLFGAKRIILPLWPRRYSVS
jgi:hypothetical protein